MSYNNIVLDNDDDSSSNQVIYKWEQGISSTWGESANINESEINNLSQEAVLLQSDRNRLLKAKSRRITSSVRRGLIRYLYVALDCSISAQEQDFRPSRIYVCKEAINKFILNYFDSNPISQLGLIITKKQTAEYLTEINSNISSHITKLKNIESCKGIASLQNVLLLGLYSLKLVPIYGSKEILIIYNSISTCDPSDILSTINELKKENIRISIICLTCEIFICKKMTEETGGTFHVALDVAHLHELLSYYVIPPPEYSNKSNIQYCDYIYIGFPKRHFHGYTSFLSNQSTITLSSVSYICPRCYCRTSDIPNDCKVCGLQLNSSSNIARSYHHLFPVNNYNEINIDKNIEENDKGNNDRMVVSKDPINCYGCNDILYNYNLQLQCNDCKSIFCVDCDLYIHESLYNCPGCSIN